MYLTFEGSYKVPRIRKHSSESPPTTAADHFSYKTTTFPNKHSVIPDCDVQCDAVHEVMSYLTVMLNAMLYRKWYHAGSDVIPDFDVKCDVIQ